MSKSYFTQRSGVDTHFGWNAFYEFVTHLLTMLHLHLRDIEIQKSIDLCLELACLIWTNVAISNIPATINKCNE